MPQLATVDHGDSPQGNEGYGHTLGSVYQMCIPHMLSRSGPHTSLLEDTANAPVHQVGTCSAWFQPVQLISPPVSILPTLHDMFVRQRNQVCSRTQQDGRFSRHIAFLSLTADHNTLTQYHHIHES